jgi:hypothetical protein
MRALLLSALLLSFVTLAPAALAAETADCSGGICDTINKICGNCIPSVEAQCAHEACEAVNRVCMKHFQVECLA